MHKAINRQRRTLALGLASMGLASAGPQRAWAQDYPSRPLRIVVPYGPGGGADTSTRLIARHLEERLGQSVIVENRSGAIGVVGTNSVAKSAADGYPLLSTAHGFTPTFFKSLPFDFAKELVPVSAAYSGGFILFTSAAFPAKTIGEFVKEVKAHPGRYNYGVSTPQTMLTAEMFKERGKFSLVKILYRVETAIPQALLTDEVHLAISTPTVYRPQVDAGKLRPLAVTSRTRSPLYPEVPTLEEAGFAGLVATYTSGFWAPAGTPRPVLDRLSREITAVMAVPEIQAYFRNVTGASAAGSTPQALMDQADRENKFWADAAQLTRYSPAE